MHYVNVVSSRAGLFGLALFGFAFAGLSVDLIARDRPKALVGDTLLTNENLLIRGSAFKVDTGTWTDMQGKLANYEASFKDGLLNNGLNTVRICCFKPPTTTIDTDYLNAVAPVVDKLIQWANEIDVYVVLNCHTTQFQPLAVADIQRFWDRFAPLYKNNTNVIYELANEPYWTSTLYADEKNIFDYVRSRAPDTHLICYSLATLNDGSTGSGPADRTPEAVIAGNQIAELTAPLGSRNASISFHSYNYIDIRWNAGLRFKNAGYTLINTEIESVGDPVPPATYDYSNLGENTLRAESNNVSWIQWIKLNYDNIVKNPPLDDNYIQYINNFVSASNAAYPQYNQKKIDSWIAPTGVTIAIQSPAQNRYLKTQNTTGNPIVANATGTTSSATRFEVTRIGKNQVTLKCAFNNKYASLNVSQGGSPILCNSTTATNPEQKFEWNKVEDGTFALQNVANNKFARANSTTGTLDAPTLTVGVNATFADVIIP